jgi:hypothetical protein
MRFNRIDFKREGHWLLVIALLLPTIGILLAVVIPRLFPR